MLLTIFFLCGAVPSASYSEGWNEPPELCKDDFTNISDSSHSCNENTLTSLLAGMAVSMCANSEDVTLCIFVTLTA